MGISVSVLASVDRLWTRTSAARAAYLFSGFALPMQRMSNRSLFIVTSGVNMLSNMSLMDLLSLW